jgi:hypothetical protein
MVASKAATDRQRQAYEAVQRAGGTVTVAAAAELGINVNSLCNLVKLYSDRTGAPYPAGMVKRDGSGAGKPVLSDIVAALEAAVTLLVAAEKRRDANLERLIHLVEEFNARQPILLMPANLPTHRRQADGGVGGRREARGE